MNLTQGQYIQLSQEFGLSPERVNQIAACTADDLADIILGEQLAGSVTTVTGWQRFVEILRDGKEIAEDILPIFQVVAAAATLVPLL